jgi:hypothetical protein
LQKTRELVPSAVEWEDSGDALHSDDAAPVETLGQKSYGPHGDEAVQQRRRSLLIAYFPRCADEALLCHALSKFGAVSQIRIIRDGRGVSKCFGFVSFEQAEAAEKAIQECEKGRVIITDSQTKKWHMKASWSDRAQGKTRRSRRGAGLTGRIRSGTGSTSSA